MIGKALEALNCADTESAKQQFLSFCHCQKWAERMADARPFASEAALFSMADECWAERNEQDYLEAFKAHPRIGDRKALAEKLAARVQQEQGQVSAAPDSVIDALAEGNDTYFDRFAIFLSSAQQARAPSICSINYASASAMIATQNSALRQSNNARS